VAAREAAANPEAAALLDAVKQIGTGKPGPGCKKGSRKRTPAERAALHAVSALADKGKVWWGKALDDMPYLALQALKHLTPSAGTRDIGKGRTIDEKPEYRVVFADESSVRQGQLHGVGEGEPAKRTYALDFDGPEPSSNVIEVEYVKHAHNYLHGDQPNSEPAPAPAPTERPSETAPERVKPTDPLAIDDATLIERLATIALRQTPPGIAADPETVRARQLLRASAAKCSRRLGDRARKAREERRLLIEERRAANQDWAMRNRERMWNDPNAWQGDRED
jgi:hypothetical protein